jgi:predicted nucleotidyltransferase
LGILFSKNEKLYPSQGRASPQADLAFRLAIRHLIECFLETKMRLDYKEIEIVRTVVETIVGRGSKVRVFGSRLNDSKRGGDLDLLVESDDPVDAIHRADLKLDLEEKLHLPLDIIFFEKGKKRTAFQELAYSRSGLL